MWGLMTTNLTCKIVSISDIHLGHPRINSLLIHENICEFLLPQLKDATHLFIVGDLFDGPINLSDTHASQILMTLMTLLTACDEYNVTMVVLEGTHSHDRYQSKILPVLHEKYNFKNHLYLISHLAIIELHDGLKILGLPDNLPFKSSDECIKSVRKMLGDRGWDYVDYALVHGCFDKFLPPHMPHQPKVTFKHEQFDFVKGRVFVGHIHFHSTYKNLIQHGSFARLAHGEEEPKGFVVLEKDSTSVKMKFIENKGSVPFLTWDVSKTKDHDKAIEVVTKKLNALPRNSVHYIRIVHPSLELRSALNRMVNEKYPDVIFSHKGIADNKSSSDKDALIIVDTISTAAPTDEELPAAIYEFLHQPESLPVETIRRLFSDIGI